MASKTVANFDPACSLEERGIRFKIFTEDLGKNGHCWQAAVAGACTWEGGWDRAASGPCACGCWDMEDETLDLGCL